MGTVEIAKLVGSFGEGSTWAVLGIVAFFGILGGLAHKLTSPPPDDKKWAVYIVVGAVTSVAVLFIVFPSEPVKLVALALAAGYGGKAILDALEARVKAAISREETAKAKENGRKAVQAGGQAVEYANQLADILEPLKKGLSEDVISEMFKPFPEKLRPLAVTPSEGLRVDLRDLSRELDRLNETFQK